MKPIFVTTSAYGATAVQANGQSHYVSIIQQAGGSGIEIRRELFTSETLPLQDLRAAIQQAGIHAVYSAPIPIWLPNGELNTAEVSRIVREALEVGAVLVKISLGSYQLPTSDLGALRELLVQLNVVEHNLQFTVENDQTAEGGNWQSLQQFLTACQAQALPVGMTFDIGNWHWTGQDATEAARALALHVVYIHCKQIEQRGDRLLTVPLSAERSAEWYKLLNECLPNDVPLAIEFPLQGADLQQVTKQYIELINNA